MPVRQALPVIVIIGLAAGLYFLFPRRTAGESIGDFRYWSPAVNEIGARTGYGDRGRFDDERHRAFARLFQDRFRNRGHAVGLKFLDERSIKAMFAPVIPKWDMARVAVQAEADARAIFHKDFQVDIYETYITAPMRKIAELRRKSPGGPVEVVFDPRFAVEQLNERRSKERQRARIRPVRSAPIAAPVMRLGNLRPEL
jgi:hypothetical protein